MHIICDGLARYRQL